MKNRKCDICSKPIVLVPSASERARKFGGKPQDYIDQFTTHTDCFIAKRTQGTLDLMRSLNK
jgi:hypothetical protein